MMYSNMMVYGNLALASEAPTRRADVKTRFVVVEGSLGHARPVRQVAHRPETSTSRLARVCAVASVVVMFLIVFVAGVSAFSNRAELVSHAASEVAWAETTIREGDSLWTLAESHPIEGLSTQETADIIEAHNSFDSVMLKAGDTVLVPSQS